MSENIRKFLLSDNEVRFLKGLPYSDLLHSEVGLIVTGEKGQWVAHISEDKIESLREHLTLLLAEQGFGDDYILNSRGQILEDLIDRFMA